MPNGKKKKRHKMATHKRKKRLRKNRHKSKEPGVTNQTFYHPASKRAQKAPLPAEDLLVYPPFSIQL